MNRKEEILKLILNESSFISVESIASTLETSTKTIRNELNSMELVVNENHCNLIRKPGVGVFIEGTFQNKQQLLLQIKSSNENKEEVLSPEERQKSILLKLLMESKPLLIKGLVLDYYVSRATINKDIQILNQQLDGFDLEIEYLKGEGVVISGDEANKRKMIAKLQVAENDQNLVVYKMTESEDSFISQFENLLNIDFKEIEMIVNDAEKVLGFSFSSEAKLNLVIHIAITINRTKQGNDISLTSDLINAIKGQPEYSIAKDTGKMIEQKFNVELSETEIYYILLHFLGAKRIKELNIDNVKLSSDQPILENLILDFIKHVQLELNLFLEADTELFNSLLLHLKPTINRLKYGLSLDNPLHEEIKFSYPAIYQAITRNVYLFKKAYNIQMPNNEIAFLVLHFAAARERNSKPIKVLVMCASGLGTSQLIVAKLKRAFSNLNIIDVVSSMEAVNYSSEEIDLIISTISISSPIKTIVINPLLPETDMKAIKELVEDKKNPPIVDCSFASKNTFREVRLDDKTDALFFLEQQAKNLGWAKSNYLEGLKYRETLGPVVIEPYIAIPHADVDTVKKSGLIFVSLTEAIEWEEDFKVKNIINVLSQKKDIRKFAGLFENLAELSDNKDWWDSLESLSDAELYKELNEKLLNHT